MMNNQYNASSLSTPHGIQMAQHVSAASPPQQPSAAVLNTFFNAQPHHHHHQQHQQLAAAVAAAGGSLYADPRQLQMPNNALDKTYYTTTLGGTPQRFYTTTTTAGGAQVGAANVSPHQQPSTILITNNFSTQHGTQAQSPPDPHSAATLSHPSNIRIVSSPGNSTNLLNSSGGYQQAQHVFNLSNTKSLQHIFPQHVLQHQQNFHQPPEIITHQFTAQQYPLPQNSTTTTSPMQMSQYYVASPPDAVQIPPNVAGKIIGSTVTTSSGTSPNSGSLTGGSSSNPSTSSTVVLDRINICINNLYTDTSSSSASNSLTSTPAQQPSPIIPAIQHKAIVDTGPSQIFLPTNEVYEPGVLVIDEPDSTTTATTPHTPPTTPENTPPSASSSCSGNNNITTTTNAISSPSTSSTTVGTPVLPGVEQDTLPTNNILNTKQSFSSAAQNIEKVNVQYSENPAQSSLPEITNFQTSPSLKNQQPLPTNVPLTPPTPPSPPKNVGNHKLHADTVDLTDNSSVHTSTSNMDKPEMALPQFSNGEDVFIKRLDGRFYLGTVMKKSPACNQYLVRFDDKTEQWYISEQMRKLGGGSLNSNTEAASKTQEEQAMCVACKQQQPASKVEICERCGRGYHRLCTKETMPGSKVWLCKRCNKPMKLNMKSDLISDDESECEPSVKRLLPYDLNSLTWDSKHRVNDEQTYCYCGKAGKFDHNMLQCCRCLNWYHTQCTNKFKGNMVRGDSFFVFCCSICNDGEELLRRLQVEWVDLVHLILYNLSTMKKYQNHKYHHLLKDIYPYAIEKRKILPISRECLLMPENDYLEKLHSTLKENTDRFVWGKEIKRDHCFFALRTTGPPVCPKISIKKTDVVTDSFIVNVLKLKLLDSALENSDVLLWTWNETANDMSVTPTSIPKSHEGSSSRDIYAFDDTSEDEIPIKLILDKVKNKNKLLRSDEFKEVPTTSSIKSKYEAMDVEDDNANDVVITKESESHDLSYEAKPNTTTEVSPKKETKSEKFSSETTSTDENLTLLAKNVSTAATCTKSSGKTSRKRKGFSLTKSYESQRLFDSSSDENSSSSSRGTSLDLIIPPPKNFLGQNNPFLIVTPEKKTTDIPTTNSTSCGSKKTVSFGIFDSSGLNFSSKLAALKSAGLFPKLSNSNLAKAAGQPRTVRTIKRRLSAKDITIGPNQEVRRRRTRRLSANIEVISTTTINPIPTNFFPIHAKDLLAAAAASATSAASLFISTPISSISTSSSPPSVATKPGNTTSCNAANEPAQSTAAGKENKTLATNCHGRRLRQRPPKASSNNTRRSSVSSNQSSTSSSTIGTSMQHQQQQQQPQTQTQNTQQSHEDFKQTVNKYFGIVNRIESGEQFSIRAKRQLSSGQIQYLIEWGEQVTTNLMSTHSPQKQQQSSQPIEATENSNLAIGFQSKKQLGKNEQVDVNQNGNGPSN